MSRLIDETDNRYGMLAVIQQAGSDNHREMLWHCQCDCGERTIVRGSCLRSGHTSSCGCQRGAPLPYGIAAMRQVLVGYRNKAKIRGLEWKLTEEQFHELTQQPCHYCGTELSNLWTTRSRSGSYSYNGLDRKDSTKGYTPNNIVPCCAQCNLAKGRLNYQDFLNLCERVYRHRVEVSK